MTLKQKKNYVLLKNNLQTVLNSHLLQSTSNHKFDLVVVVQSHKRYKYLQALMQSLHKARGINKILLIVSHDYLLTEMRTVVESVQFCPVIQIFFPYSAQLHPDVFPGTDPRDCKRDTPKELALVKKCLNANYPDQFGHYREADYTMTKHHWWWKINFVFDQLNILKDYKGLVLLLEEDHYVAPDFLTIMKLLEQKRNSEYPNCDFLGLGSYNRHGSYSHFKHKVADYVAWASNKNNMGMAMNRATFDKIKRCNNQFCRFDDYNWDWTIQSLSSKCLNRPLTILTMQAPHVFHAGECSGLHHKRFCKMEDTITAIERSLSANMDYLFPQTIGVTSQNREIRRFAGVSRPNGYGGWGDIRDHKLCMSYVKSA
ncbi:uncharacterized protein TRIADDRAFT_31240 [Trichoplax adhaerens]|uniref:Alpha-1,6-mannosyl-glycoprotein 2-beta-N-acetylglucosaminyltransferase n=1 Tax=Trichoplax adhaerens TaxID=10228 RepID=B3S8T7_TRIAD|nr:hypothetical protein TRIADDRAFT_31240 [Trichoplax adhaerens]EDV20761.1 hypothetical protein TRIADDRAFT_31240 [Trichoplax adhaerens]|eukprot:XP_002116702.1 hypothetical protein TRIADDRAFT_31240 [Trichoplax adhaerens]